MRTSPHVGVLRVARNLSLMSQEELNLGSRSPCSCSIRAFKGSASQREAGWEVWVWLVGGADGRARQLPCFGGTQGSAAPYCVAHGVRGWILAAPCYPTTLAEGPFLTRIGVASKTVDSAWSGKPAPLTITVIVATYEISAQSGPPIFEAT